ncbi:MAG TPA: DUF6599 family protein, partial [Thermoanaerobaculia bacterium]
MARVAVALVALLLAAACGDDDDKTTKVVQAALARPTAVQAEENFASIDSPSLQFLPRHREAAAWQLEEDPIVVPGNRLETYLGADSRPFTHYEAIDVAVGKYAGVGNNGFATVEIFRFPDFVKAFGAYSMRKTTNAQYLQIANEAFLSKHTLHLWRGPFYVRVTGASPDGNAIVQL